MNFFSVLRAFDFAILDALHTALSCRALDVFFSVVTLFGDAGIFWLGVGVVMLFVKRFRRCGICLLTAVALGFLLGNLILKPLVARIRPYDVNTMIRLVITPPTDYSFPSGHTMASFGAALSILYHHKKLGIPAVILASLIALSRMYLYVHYPSDIIGGILVAIASSWAAWTLVDAAFRRRERRLHGDAAVVVSRD